MLSNKALQLISPITNCIVTDFRYSFSSANELSAEVYKNLDDIECISWDDIQDGRIIFCPELKEYYKLSVTLQDDKQNEFVKRIVGTSLCEEELSNIKIYNLEINTESDILREEYTTPTTFYNPNKPEASLLHRILEKAPHYQIGNIAKSLHDIQRTFSISDANLYDCLTSTIANELNCLFTFDTTTRSINAYDLFDKCDICGERFELEDTCPVCNSTKITKGYGDDSKIFISRENLAENITLTTNNSELKNCFKLKAGDALMTDTIRTINPNGSDYIYHFSDIDYADMPDELTKKLIEYDKLYTMYEKVYIPSFDNTIRSNYNNVVSKYNNHKYSNTNADDEVIYNDFMKCENIIGYSNISKLMYSNISLSIYLESGLLPNTTLNNSNAAEEAKKVTTASLGSLGLETYTSNTSIQTIESALTNYVKVLINPLFSIDTITSSYIYASKIWKGKFTLTRRGDNSDTATTGEVTVNITDEYDVFLKQKIEKKLRAIDDDLVSIFDIFKVDSTTDFKTAIAYYSRDRLQSFVDAYQSALDILIDVDQASPSADLYEVLYIPYLNRQKLLEAEIRLRREEIDSCTMLEGSLQTIRGFVQDSLDIKKYLGNTLWKLFCSYRREDIYENQNYISEGMIDADLIKTANEFMDTAKKEIKKANTPQYTISSNVINFLHMPEFKQFAEGFELGNWIRFGVENEIYKMRLISYAINYRDLTYIDIEFSTASELTKIVNPIKEILSKSKSMATTYSYYARQASSADKAADTVKDWVNNGISLNNNKIAEGQHEEFKIDNNGILLRSYDDINQSYSPEQMKLTNTTLSITDNGWNSVTNAIGKFRYLDPVTQTYKTSYGILADAIVGKLILGESLFLFSDDNYSTLSFNSEGLILNAKSNGGYKSIFQIQKDGEPIFYIDTDGEIVQKSVKFSGAITASSINIKNNFVVTSSGNSTIRNTNILSGKVTADIVNSIITQSHSNRNPSLKIENGQIDFYDYNNTNKTVGSIKTNNSTLTLSHEQNSEIILGQKLANGTIKPYVSLSNLNIYPINICTDIQFLQGIILANDSKISVENNNLTIDSKGSLIINICDKNTIIIDNESTHITSDITVDGKKSRVVTTKSYGKRLLNTLDSTIPLFEDVGTSTLDENGKCIVYFEMIFKETVNTEVPYYVQLTKCGEGDIYISEKHKDYFEVTGTPDLMFDWSVKASQINYETERLEQYKII